MSAAAEEEDPREHRTRLRLYRHIGYRLRDASLDHADKLTFAEEILGEKVESYSDLSIEALEDILFVLNGWRVIQKIRLANGAMTAEAEVMMQRLNETADETAERQTRDDSWN